MKKQAPVLVRHERLWPRLVNIQDERGRVPIIHECPDCKVGVVTWQEPDDEVARNAIAADIERLMAISCTGVGE